MATIPSSQGAPQASNIAVQDALPLIGSPSRENGQSVLNSIDSDIARLYEDRNILLTDGGTITFSGTSVQFTENLKLSINSRVAGGSPQVISLGSATRTLSADGKMLYAVIDRSLGTAVITDDATSLPSVVAANKEVVLIAKRMDAGDLTKRLYFRSGFIMNEGDSGRLGSATGLPTTFSDSTFRVFDNGNATKQIALEASAISPSTTRTITMPDANVDLGNISTNASNITILQETNEKGFQGFIDDSAKLIAVNAAPGAGEFFSSVLNRASIPDITANLKPSGQLDRVSVQKLVEIPEEFGPNYEKVWSDIKDTFGFVRFVGSWQNHTISSAYGPVVRTTTQSDFVEITFLGEGLNILVMADGNARTAYATVDNGSESVTNIYPASAISNTTGAQKYVQNIVLPVVTGLSFGVHTVKIRNASANNIYFSGYEIINESSNLEIQPGASYINGKKLVSGSQTSVSFNSGGDIETGTIGTRGGHMLAKHKADGTVKRDFTPSLVADLAYLASANHSNEEVLRRHHWREFGAGRSDDFSLYSGGLASKSFVLDDGTTSLVGNSVNLGTGSAGIWLGTTGSFLTLTFVGTGLDFIRSDTTGTIDSHDFYIDGTLIGNITGGTGNNAERLQKVVSGLPYGTHTFKIIRVAAVSASIGLTSFIVYGPKKPALSSGAIELADYFLNSNYTANSTAGALTIAPGVLRKHATREVALVGSWIANYADSNYIGGQFATTSTNTDYAQITFYGTGFECRMAGNTANSHTGQFTVDGSTNLSSYTTSYYGNITSFTAATGTYVTTVAAAQFGMGLVVSGLTEGIHTVKLTKTAGAGSLNLESFDIVNTTHSPRSNLPSDLQNSLLVGSCSLSDNRKTSVLKEPLDSEKIRMQAVGVTSGPSTTATSFVPAPDMSLTVPSRGAWFELNFEASFGTPGSGNQYMQFYVDGYPVGISTVFSGTASSAYYPCSNTALVYLPYGTHKIDVYWMTSTSTVFFNGTDRILTAKEL